VTVSDRARPWAPLVRRVAGLLVAGASGALLLWQACRGVSAIGHGTIGPAVAWGGPWWLVVVAVLLLGGVGALPAWRLVGSRPLAVFLAPCLGALLAGVSAVVTVAVASEPLEWFVAFAAAMNAAALASVAAPRDHSDHRRVGPSWSRWSAAAVGFVALGVAAAAMFATSSPVGPSSVASARTSWLALAAVLVHGHHAVGPAVSVSGTAGARLLASPLAAGSSAVTWLVGRSRPAGAAATVLAVVTVSALGAVGAAISEMARTVTLGVDGDRSGGQRSSVVQSAGLLGAAAWILAAYGAIGSAGISVLGSTVTLLWSSAIAGAVAFGLVLPADRWRLRAVVVLGAVAALASPLGGVLAAILAVLVTWRRLADGRRRHDGTGWFTNLAGGLVAMVAAGTWPVASVIVGGVPLHVGGSVVSGGLASGLHATWHVLQAPLTPVVAAGVVALVGAVLFRRGRAQCELGSDVATAVTALVPLAAVLVATVWLAPVLAPWRVAPAVAATVLPLLLAWLAMAAWFVLGVDIATSAGGCAVARSTAPAGTRTDADRAGGAGGRAGVDGSRAGRGAGARPGPDGARARGGGDSDRSRAGGGGGASGAGVDGNGSHVLHPSP